MSTVYKIWIEIEEITDYDTGRDQYRNLELMHSSAGTFNSIEAAEEHAQNLIDLGTNIGTGRVDSES